MSPEPNPQRTQGRGSVGASVLVNFFEAHNVGHVVEALHFCLGHHTADPALRLGLLLNAAAPAELAGMCPFVDEVYRVRLPGYPDDVAGLTEADCLDALQGVPRAWDYVADNPRRWVWPHAMAVPGFARYFEASDRYFRPRLDRVPVGHDPPGYAPRQQLRLKLPQDAGLRAGNLFPDGTPRIAVLPAGSSERWLYPSTSSWEIILRALARRFPRAVFCLVGKLKPDQRTSTSMGEPEVERLRRASPRVVDRFDAGLQDQLAAVRACDLLISPHSGFGMAALAVGTPWLTISGGRWPEYFFNGIPFYSMLPGPEHFSPYARFDSLPVLEDDEDGEGPRTPTMSRGRILADLDELLEATRLLAEGKLGYREALRNYYQAFLDLHDGDRSRIFSIDNVHQEFV